MAVLFLTVLLLTQHVAAENIIEEENIATTLNQSKKGGIIIIDGSGSMWGQRNGEAKITTVKKSLIDLFKNKLTDNARVGLMSYGHNREADCEDIEVLVSLQSSKLDRENLIKAVVNLKPRGKTPLSASIKQAVESLKGRKGEGLGTSIFLFSDGQESCNQNPCAIAHSLKELNPAITISTVAFTIAEEEGKEQLKCIAEETGGSYFESDIPEQLQKAMNVVAAELDSDSVFGLQLKVEGGELRGTELEWTILSVKTETPRFEENYSGGVIDDIEPGEYEIYVRGLDADVFGSVRVEVKPDKLTIATVPLKRDEKEINVIGEGDIPAGSKIKFTWDFIGNDGDLIYIMTLSAPDLEIETDEKKIFRVNVSDKKQLSVPINPREYELRYYDIEKKRVIARKKFTVGPPGIKLTVPEKVIVGADVKVEWSGPSSPEDILFVAPRDLPTYIKPSDLSYTASAEEGETLTLPTPAKEGLWEVRYFSWDNEVSISFAEFETVLPEVTLNGPHRVPAGSPIEVEFTGRGGKGDIVFWSEPNEPVDLYYKYEHEGRQDALEDDIEDGSPLLMVAPTKPGDYEIRFFNVKYGGLLARHSIEVTLPNVILDIPESMQVGTRFEVVIKNSPNAPGDIVFLASTEWEKNTIPKDISYHHASNDKSIVITAPRQPGKYEIRYYSYSNGTALVTKQFEVY